jgi:hypothetical protein
MQGRGVLQIEGIMRIADLNAIKLTLNDPLM